MKPLTSSLTQKVLSLLTRSKVRFGSKRRIMIKPTEMDEKVTFSEQLEEDVGLVILIDKFNVVCEAVDQLLKV
jgi:hypothetical protein